MLHFKKITESIPKKSRKISYFSNYFFNLRSDILGFSEFYDQENHSLGKNENNIIFFQFRRDYLR